MIQYPVMQAAGLRLLIIQAYCSKDQNIELKTAFYLGKPQKSSLFSGPATKALTPPPGLVAIRTFFLFVLK